MASISNDFVVKHGITVKDTAVIQSTIASTNTSTGALTVAGGAGIAGNVNIGGVVTGRGIRTTSASTAPTNPSPSPGDIWYNTATDDIYRYTSDGVNAYWLDITGPSVANISSSFSAPVLITNVTSATSISTGALVVAGGGGISGSLYVGNSTTITYQPPSATGYALTLIAKDTQGGIGYADFLKTTNTTSGATNPNKSFRLNSTGAIEIINSAYTATLFNLSDSGNLSVSGDYRINGKKAVNGPAFRAYIGNAQTITSGTQQKVTFNAETFDTDGCFASNRFTPNVEGYYQLNSTVRIAGTSGTAEVMIILYKNGSEYSRGTNESGVEQGNNFYSMQVSDIAYANGSTDYFEIYIQQSSGGNRDTTAGQAISYFSGSMIRGA